MDATRLARAPGRPNVPFRGLIESFQAYVDYASQFVDNHFAVPIEVLIILIPLLFGLLKVVKPVVTEFFIQNFSSFSQKVEREIICDSVPAYRTPKSIAQNRNAVVQNAIFLYLTQVVWEENPLPAHVWNNKSSTFLLVDPYQSRVYESGSSVFKIKSSDSETIDSDASVKGLARSSKYLNRLVLIKLPIGGPRSNSWVPTGVKDIEITYSRTVSRVDKCRFVQRSITLRAFGKGASERIEQFIRKCLSHYISVLPRLSMSSRLYFELQHSREKEVIFKRYPLADSRSFNTLFFPEREKIMRLLDNFMFRKGRFAIEGFPQKIGFLLYGPSGTGKTSFVKALAHYTGRHVVTVPLHLIKTNQQLFDIMLTRNYSCVGESEKHFYNMNELIFYIDASEGSSKLVTSRVKKRTIQFVKPARLSSADAWELNSDDENGAHHQPNVEEYEEQEVEIEENDNSLKFLMDSMAERNEESLPMKVASDSESYSLQGKRREKRSIFQLIDSADKLDLSGLLNVLDGVVETPGRIIVMATKNPELVDPALIRPGRISCKVKMDYIRWDALVSMAGLHYGEVTPEKSSSTQTAIARRLEEELLPKNEQEINSHKNDAKADSSNGSKSSLPFSQDTAPLLELTPGMVEARLPLRSLSHTQKIYLRDRLVELEKEAGEISSEAGDSKCYKFHITHGEVEILCIEKNTFEEFVDALSSLIRGELVY